MDDGGRCLLDVINDPNLLRSFLESGSEKVQEILTGQRNVWQCQTLTSVPEVELNTQNVHYTALSNALDQQELSCSDAVLEGAHLRQDQISSADHFSSTILVSEPSSEQLGYTRHIDNASILGQSTSIGPSTIVSSPAAISSYQTTSPAGTTVHHIPSPAHPQPSPATPRSLTPLPHAGRSPSQGPPSVQSVHSMPPPSPLQQTRSPLPPHTPSPAPSWSPVSFVQTNATGRSQTAAHSQILQTSSNVTQVVQAMSPQLAQKLQLQQPVILQHQPQQPRLSVPSPSVIPSTASVPMAAPPVVQIIPAPAPQQTQSVSSRSQQSSVRPIQPKQPQQILPKPAGTPSSQFATPTVKQVGTPTIAANQRTVGMGINAGQMVIGQGQPGVFAAGPQGTIVLNSLISAVGQNPILIQGNIPGVQWTLRPQHSSLTTSASSGQSQSSAQNNAALIAALQAQSQPAQTLFTQTKASLPGQQTIVIPNSITHPNLTAQNLNLAAANPPVNNTVVPSGPQSQALLARPNIILTQRLVGPNQGIQFQQIQTAQGPLTVAIGHGQHISLPQIPALQNTALGGPHINAATIPVSGVMPTGQGVISSLSLQPTPNSASLPLQQQALSGANVTFHSHKEQPSVQVASISSSTPSSTPTTSQAPMVTETSSTSTTKQVPTVDLANILREHGIVPEESPTASPESSPQPELQVATAEEIGQLGAIDIAKQSPLAEVLQSSPQVITVQPNQTVPQVKLTLAHDGSVILQSHPMPPSGIPQGQAQSLEVQTSAVTVTPYVNSSTSSSDFVSSTSQTHSALLARLNAAPAVEVMPSLALAGSICTPTTVTSTVAATPTISPLIPLTVQNISDGIVPVAPTRLSQPVTTTTSGQETVFQEPCIPVCNSTENSTRINHVILGLQVNSSQGGSVATTLIPTSSTETISDNPGIVSAIGTLSSAGATTKAVQHDVSQGLPTSNISTIHTTVIPNQNVQLSVPNQQMEAESGKIQQSQVHLQPVATSVVSAQTQPNTVTGQNVHLVNLLKQSPVQSIPLRVIAPVPGSASSSTSDTINTVTNIAVPTQVRVGNQILTLAPHQRHTIQSVQNPFRNLTDQQQFPQTQQVVLRIQQNQQLQQQQQQQQSSVSTVTVPGVIQIQNKIGSVNRIGIPVTKTNRFQQQLRNDHNAVIHPDYKQPFQSVDDACRRLLPFHVFNTSVHQEEELTRTDMMFEAMSAKYLERIQKMKYKYQLLLLKESMKSSPTPERVMLERMFIQDETEALKEDRRLVEEGKTLDLPPPPDSWSKMISPSDGVENCVKQESVEADTPEECTVKKVLKPLECKGTAVKRKAADEETNDVCNMHVTRLAKAVKSPEEPLCNNRIKTEVFSEISQKSSSDCSSFPNHNSKVQEVRKEIDDCKDEDIVTTLRRELNMSPIEDDEPDVVQVDFETADGTSGLADFEPPVARTEESSVVSSYANGSRTAVKMKYDFNMISNTAEWINDYTNHDRKVISESEAAVESILEGQEEDSNLDLSSIGLDESLERQEVLYNGIEESSDSYVNYSQYENPKLRTHKEREKHTKVNIRSDHSTNELEQSAQVQSAIKSILELQQPENHSYFTDEEENFASSVYSLERNENHQSAMDYEVSLDADIEIAGSESDAVLDEAVRSILLR